MKQNQKNLLTPSTANYNESIIARVQRMSDEHILNLQSEFPWEEIQKETASTMNERAEKSLLPVTLKPNSLTESQEVTLTPEAMKNMINT